jgi:transcription antitermination protein NusB
MKDRREARRLALDVLYEAEIRDSLPVDAFESRNAGGWVLPSKEDDEGRGPVPQPPSDRALDYARALVEGVQGHQADIDALIARYADRWAIQRMPVVDRTLLRIALFELLWREDVPVAVAINEAVELAKALSTDDSGRFINGLLGRIVEKEDLE